MCYVYLFLLISCIFLLFSAPVETVKEAIPADTKPNSTQPNVSITSTTIVEPTPTTYSVPSVAPAETKAAAAVSSNELKPTPSTEPALDLKTPDFEKAKATKIPDSKSTDPKPPGIKSPVSNKSTPCLTPSVSPGKVEPKPAVEPKTPGTKSADSSKNAPSSTSTASPAKSGTKPAVDTEESAVKAESGKTEKISDNTKPAVTTEPEPTASPAKVTDPPVKASEEPVKIPPAKPKRQTKVIIFESVALYNKRRKNLDVQSLLNLMAQCVSVI